MSVLSINAFLLRDIASDTSTSLAHVNGGSYSGHGEEENENVVPTGGPMLSPQLRERDAGVVPSSISYLTLPPEYRTVYSDSNGL